MAPQVIGHPRSVDRTWLSRSGRWRPHIPERAPPNAGPEVTQNAGTATRAFVAELAVRSAGVWVCSGVGAAIGGRSIVAGVNRLEQEVAKNVTEPALVFIGCPVPVNDEEFIALVGRDREHRFGGAVGVEIATQRLLVGEERDDSGGSEVAARFDVGEEGREFRIGFTGSGSATSARAHGHS